MRTLIDVRCDGCAVVEKDRFVPIPFAEACACGGTKTRVMLPRGGATVIGDDIPGGILINNGICYEDGTPRRFYSRSDMKRAAQEKGLENVVRHTPMRGTDKSPHTTRWV